MGQGKRNTRSDDDEAGTWKKKFKKAIKTPGGLSHVMSVLISEEQSNSSIVSAVQQTKPPQFLPPAPTTSIPSIQQGPAPNFQVQSAAIIQLAAAFPALATKVQLQSILKPGRK